MNGEITITRLGTSWAVRRDGKRIGIFNNAEQAEKYVLWYIEANTPQHQVRMASSRKGGIIKQRWRMIANSLRLTRPSPKDHSDDIEDAKRYLAQQRTCEDCGDPTP